MSIIAWLVFGVAAGLAASKIACNHGEAVVLDVILGTAGALIGGFAVSSFGPIATAGLNAPSLVAALAGAVAFLLIHHKVLR
jgi:uncharacterized membrane protein YeaQ/YmgE (transglycosylase-associated protein family)